MMKNAPTARNPRAFEPKYSPIKKVETIKIINEELVSDFKQVYNNDYNDLINLYHLCLRFCIDA